MITLKVLQSLVVVVTICLDSHVLNLDVYRQESFLRFLTEKNYTFSGSFFVTIHFFAFEELKVGADFGLI